jgi:hypothetical protein
VLHAVQHVAEHLEGLALVLLLGVLLRVAAQVDALAQVVHRGEMLLPLHVELLQHDGLLEVPHDLRADRRDLRLVVAVGLGEHVRGDGLRVGVLVGLDPLL